MSTPIPSQLQGTISRNSIEMLWEKHRRTINTVAVALVAALGINYAVKYYVKAQADKKWEAFAVAVGLDTALEKPGPGDNAQAKFGKALAGLSHDLLDRIEKADPSQLEKAGEAAPPEQAPYYLWALAQREIAGREWEKAEATLQRLKQKYPSHALCEVTQAPVQFQKNKKNEDDAGAKKPKAPDLEPAKEGSAVDLLLGQIARAKGYTEPAQFAKLPIPANAPKVKFKLKGNWGEFTIALLPEKAPKHVEEFLKLVESKFWSGKDPSEPGVRIDELRRQGSEIAWQRTPMQFHFGLLSTKQDDRTKWNTTDKCDHPIDFEETQLGHFPGAVAASFEGDKSCIDRIWIGAEDNPALDGQQVVFGYVVEGMDVVKSICEASFSSEQEEKRGSGKPQDNIEILSVELLP